MQLHHVGYLTKDLALAKAQFELLGFAVERPSAYDPVRDVNIAFLTNGPYRVELIEPAGPSSPQYPLLRRYKNTPYHFCYVARDLDAEIEALSDRGYHLMQPVAEAPCIDGRAVAFLLHPDIGMVELIAQYGSARGRELIALIGEKNPLQKKALADVAASLTAGEWEELERVLLFYQERMTMQALADAYLLFLTDTLEQTKYFVTQHHYRYSTFAEVEDLVYHDREYMSKYMVGLSLSSYLWSSHLELNRWFREKLRQVCGGAYLEIGPGHGRHFCAAISAGGFQRYDAVDLSESSVEQTAAYVRHFAPDQDAAWNVYLQDFERYTPPTRYDCVVAMEVLEHLEDPLRMLKKMAACSHPGGYVLLTVPVNAPEIDHIYLFRSTQAVEDMVAEAGIEIVERCYVTSGKNISLEKAAKKNYAIIAGILGRIK